MQTVIGIFDNVYDAQKATQQLKSAGFSDSDVDVTVRDADAKSSSDFRADNTADTTGYTTGSGVDTSNLSGSSHTARTYENDTDGDSFGDKVSKFFRNLFGSDNDEADRYSHVANKTGCVVTVHATTEEEAKRASDILDEYGAVDVNDRASEYGYTGSGSNYAASGLGDTASGLG